MAEKLTGPEDSSGVAPSGGKLYYLSFLVLVVNSVTFGYAYIYIYSVRQRRPVKLCGTT